MPAGHGNFAPARLIADHYGIEAGPLLATVSALLMVGILVYGRRRLTDSRSANGYAVGLGLLWTLIAAPLAWQHYFLFTVPLFLLLLSPVGPGFGPRLLAVPALPLLAINPFAELLSVTDPIRQAPLVHLGGVLLLGASLWAVCTTSDSATSSH